ncbi:MAG: hypothetical protein HQK99_02995 [Nitrospirae bacterium]|nr:hypothetical protein [Nitrospirota bacterium]
MIAETLPEDITVLKEIIKEQQVHVHILEEQVRLLKAKLFGRKSEKSSEASEEQLQLFDEIEAERERQSVPFIEENS